MKNRAGTRSFCCGLGDDYNGFGQSSRPHRLLILLIILAFIQIQNHCCCLVKAARGGTSSRGSRSKKLDDDDDDIEDDDAAVARGSGTTSAAASGGGAAGGGSPNDDETEEEVVAAAAAAAADSSVPSKPSYATNNVPSTTNVDVDDDQSLAMNRFMMINELLGNGGFVNKAIELQQQRSDDDDSYSYYAIQDIQEGEILIYIPQNLILFPKKNPSSFCDLTHTLLKKQKKESSSSSSFNQYINYIMEDSSSGGILPYRWSNKAKKIVRSIIGDELPSTVLQPRSRYESICGYSSKYKTVYVSETGNKQIWKRKPSDMENNIEPNIYEYVLRKAMSCYDNVINSDSDESTSEVIEYMMMIPLIKDFIQHRTGHWQNVELSYNLDGLAESSSDSDDDGGSSSSGLGGGGDGSSTTSESSDEAVEEEEEEEDEDEDEFVEGGGYVALKAIRKIEKGEQLYLSLYQDYFCNSYVSLEDDNDDPDDDALITTRNNIREATIDDGAYYYSTQDLLHDQGIMENFPQRWVFNPVDLPGFNHWDWYDSDDDKINRRKKHNIIFELDVMETANDGRYLHALSSSSSSDSNNVAVDNKKMPQLLNVTWLSKARPDLMMRSAMESQVERLDAMEDWLETKLVRNLKQSNHERDTIWKYYKSLRQALQYAIWSTMEEKYQFKNVLVKVDGDDPEDEDFTIQIPKYHNFHDVVRKRQGGESSIPFTCHPEHQGFANKYQRVYEVESQYQHIGFKHSRKKDDTCLFLSHWAQTCTSFRQYHEALVHYPASFIPEVKRVAYLGGGDNMILHEILKYPSIELVLGMELDQFVVRYSYMNFGTLPYFDDPRVQWWFGDATKSLLMFPEDYFGSFDLVLIDLQTFVADALRVTPELSVMDTMKLLLKPTTGVISKNEDFPNRAVTDFAKYTVDLEYCDLPQLCRQSITIGSNGINFLKAKQYNHGIDTIYLKESLINENRFNDWYGFRENEIAADDAVPRSLSQSSTPDDDDDEQPEKKKTTSHAVLSIIEVEDLSDSAEHTKEAQTKAIREVLEQHGLKIVKITSSEEETSKSPAAVVVYNIVFILQEGYIVIRKRSVDNYVALDMALWDGVEKMNDLKRSLIESIGGDEDSSSSYKMVTGGINGIGRGPYILGSKTTRTGDIESCDNDDAVEGEDGVSLSASALSTIWREMLAMITTTDNPTVVVLCGMDGETCTTKSTLEEEDVHANVVEIYSCPGLTDDSHQSSLFECEVEMTKMIQTLSASPIQGFWIDSSVSKPAAKVFFRLVSSLLGKARIMSQEDCVVFLQLTGDQWRNNFLSMFKTEVAPFAPSKEVKLTFGQATEFGLFSSNDKDFYFHMGNTLAGIERKIGVAGNVKTAESGLAKYIPDFAPIFFNNTSYDNSRAYSQWQSQEAIGFQTIFQFELEAPKIPLEEFEEVLFNSDVNIWTGEWVKARVGKLNDDGTYNLKEKVSKKRRNGVSRNMVRRLDFDNASKNPPIIDVGTRVLIRKRTWWVQGFVVSQYDDGIHYDIRFFEGEGGIRKVNIKGMMPQFEPTLDEELPTLTMGTIEVAFRKALTMSRDPKESSGIQTSAHAVGDGGAIVAFYQEGSALLTWDGDKHIDINFYLDNEDKKVADKFQKELLANIKYLALRSKDQQPRGYGRVVNFASEIDHERVPLWWSKTRRDEKKEDEEED